MFLPQLVLYCSFPWDFIHAGKIYLKSLPSSGLSFLLSSWYSDVFLGFSMRIMLINCDVLVVAKKCLPWVNDFFSVSCSTSEELHRRLAQGVARTGGAKLAKGIFHTTERHSWYMVLAGRGWLLFKDGLGQWAVGNCVVYHLFLLESLALSPSLYNYSLTNYNNIGILLLTITTTFCFN